MIRRKMTVEFQESHQFTFQAILGNIKNATISFKQPNENFNLGRLKNLNIFSECLILANRE